MRYRRGMLVVLGVSALAAGAQAGSAQAGSAQVAAPADNVSSPSVSSADAQDGVAYWTRERMAAAKPREVTPAQHASAPATAPEPADPPLLVPPAAGGAPEDIAPTPSGPPQPLATTASSADAQDGVAYWTRERMAAAKPREVTPAQHASAPATAPEPADPPLLVPPAAGGAPEDIAPTPSGPPQPLATTPAPK